MSAQIAFSESITTFDGTPLAAQPPIVLFDGRAYTVAVFHKNGGWFKTTFDNHSLSVNVSPDDELTSEQRAQILGAPPKTNGLLYYLYACGLDGHPDRLEWIEDEEEALAVLAAIEKAKSA